MDLKDSRLNVTSASAYVKPSDNIICANCKYRNKSKDGFKKGICEKYDHKSLAILYKNASCELYVEDTENEVSSL